jgi:hypothetical protein
MMKIETVSETLIFNSAFTRLTVQEDLTASIHRKTFEYYIINWQRTFPLPSAPRPALGPTQPPIQWVPGALSPGVKRGRGVMLTTHPLLVPRWRKLRSYTSCHPNAPLWSVTGQICVYVFMCVYIYIYTHTHTHTYTYTSCPLYFSYQSHE